nr:immunoglobulin light chain junction region [Macaca mulatta]MOX51150.1 immunoglobulin light chain junction region [Macaca mulatta]
CQETGNVALTF